MNLHTKLVQQGELLAEVDVALIDDDTPETGWGPYLSLSDAQKLDEVRDALRDGNLEKAGRMARVFKLVPLAV